MTAVTAAATPAATSDEDREALRSSVRAFLEARSPEREVRRLMEDDLGYDPDVLTQMADQLGLLGLAVPEEHGGSGFTYVELCLVLEEMGRALLGGPFFGTAVLATVALLESGDAAAQAEHLPEICAGRKLATLAVDMPLIGSRPACSVRARETADGWVLDGTAPHVIDGDQAELLVVVAQTGDGIAFFTVDAAAAGLERHRLPAPDLTRRYASVTFTGVEAGLLGEPAQADEVLERVLAVCAVALAAEQVGGCEQAMRMAVDYSKVRHQFGRPIGSFQAVKHLCADMLMRVESGKAAARHAARAAADRSPDMLVLASLAKAYCSDAYVAVTEANVQVHGGIGYTWEHASGLHLKRAKTSELVLGDARYHRDKLGSLLGV